MLDFLRRFFTKDIGLKLISLLLALGLWFYVVKELNKGTEEERQFFQRIMPQHQLVAKKLTIKPIFVGKPRSGFVVANNSVVIVPDYCIVVGAKEIMNKIRYVYTTPIDVSGVTKTFTKSVPLNPIAPGVYMEETLVQVTVPVERRGKV